MNKKSCLIAVCLMIAGYLSAAEYKLEIDGSFQKRSSDGLATGWQVHPWEGYKPYPVLKVTAGPEGENFLSVRNVSAVHGVAVKPAIPAGARLRGRSGDQLNISFRIRGKGRAQVNLYYYTDREGWNRPSAWSRSFQLKPQWDSHVYNMVIENGYFAETGHFELCFGTRKGGEFDLASVRAVLTEGKYRGEAPLPQNWTVFAPMKPDFVPSAEELKSIPGSLNQQKGRPGKMTGGCLDFIPFVGGRGVGKCGWAFARLKSGIDCDYTIGAGADWWMQVYLNGELILDTVRNGKQGNIKSPVAMDNYVKTVRLKKGDNFLAVKLISGIASADFFMGGPADLRRKICRYALNKIHWVENFDRPAVSCTGNPELIQGHPTPGLLSLTGQAVFKTTDSLKIIPEKQLMELSSNPERFAAMGLRIQKFGRQKQEGAVLRMQAKMDSAVFETKISSLKNSEQLKIEFCEEGRILDSKFVPYTVLPADFLFSFSRSGEYNLNINSLVDSSTRSFSGYAACFLEKENARGQLMLQADKGGTAEMVADNFIIGESAKIDQKITVPFKIDRQAAFDPVKEGWKLIFSDEFNDREIDWTKWFQRSEGKEYVSLRDGKLVIKADWNKEKTRIRTTGLYSRQRFLYGYFEARVRFRKESGWWAAFWLCSMRPHNPFINGFEIDIFEDYYLKAETRGGKPGNILDHNLHINTAQGYKSWNYRSTLPGSIEDFYVIGCKWTPFEISYYMNGRLIGSSSNHSPYDSVTFDAFHHGASITPIRAILSGQAGQSGGKPENGIFPEEFLVDYVRIYEYPNADRPKIRMEVAEPEFAVPLGETLHFKAEVIPSAASKAKITNVYLMDSGFLLDYRNKPPYVFEVPLTQEFYDITSYPKPGRSGQKINLSTNLHAYSILAQDEKGQVGWAEPVVKLLRRREYGRPYQGRPHAVPGKIKLSHYNEGGQEVAYFDTTPQNVFDRTGKFRPGEAVDGGENVIGNVMEGEWLNFTVDVKQTGTYRALLHYGTPYIDNLGNGVWLLVDEKKVGDFEIRRHKADHWGVDSLSSLSGVHLTRGTHIITVLFRAAANYSMLEFLPEK